MDIFSRVGGIEASVSYIEARGLRSLAEAKDVIYKSAYKDKESLVDAVKPAVKFVTTRSNNLIVGKSRTVSSLKMVESQLLSIMMVRLKDCVTAREARSQSAITHVI